jgi:hypothetical protein
MVISSLADTLCRWCSTVARAEDWIATLAVRRPFASNACNLLLLGLVAALRGFSPVVINSRRALGERLGHLSR